MGLVLPQLTAFLCSALQSVNMFTSLPFGIHHDVNSRLSTLGERGADLGLKSPMSSGVFSLPTFAAPPSSL